MGNIVSKSILVVSNVVRKQFNSLKTYVCNYERTIARDRRKVLYLIKKKTENASCQPCAEKYLQSMTRVVNRMEPELLALYLKASGIEED